MAAGSGFPNRGSFSLLRNWNRVTGLRRTRTTLDHPEEQPQSDAAQEKDARREDGRQRFPRQIGKAPVRDGANPHQNGVHEEHSHGKDRTSRRVASTGRVMMSPAAGPTCEPEEDHVDGRQGTCADKAEARKEKGRHEEADERNGIATAHPACEPAAERNREDGCPADEAHHGRGAVWTR